LFPLGYAVYPVYDPWFQIILDGSADKIHTRSQKVRYIFEIEYCEQEDWFLILRLSCVMKLGSTKCNILPLKWEINYFLWVSFFMGKVYSWFLITQCNDFQPCCWHLIRGSFLQSLSQVYCLYVLARTEKYELVKMCSSHSSSFKLIFKRISITSN
jgi:hypothetical protein